jgi:hypothetical protein
MDKLCYMLPSIGPDYLSFFTGGYGYATSSKSHYLLNSFPLYMCLDCLDTLMPELFRFIA